MSNDSNYLFVYGTLLIDLTHEISKFLASHASFISKGYFYGKLYKVSWFPGAILCENMPDKVYGTLFKVHDFKQLFKVLDQYEGIGAQFSEPYLFRKELIKVFLENGSSYKTWVYLYNRPVDKLVRISSGDFIMFSNKGY